MRGPRRPGTPDPAGGLGRLGRRPADAPRVVLHSRRALRRLLWAPGELGLGRAYVSGDLDIDGDVFAALAALSSSPRLGKDEVTPLTWRQRGRLIATTARLGALGPNPKPPPEEVRLTGNQHGPNRDQRAVSHHYEWATSSIGSCWARRCSTPAPTSRTAQPAWTRPR